MSAGTDLIAPGARLVDAGTGTVLAGTGLAGAVGTVTVALDRLPPGAVFARTGLTLDATLRYLGCWAARRPVALIDPALHPATLAELVRRFAPAALVGLDEGGTGASAGEVPPGYAWHTPAGLGPCWLREQVPAVPAPHPDLAVLLATSGSTGSPKLVRLSRAAIAANASAIARSLGIDAGQIAPTSLPLFYSYGMSVLNSHLAAGATVVVIDGGVLAREFWQAVDRYRATSLAGVPYHYEMLARIRWSPAQHPSLRVLTQAGGRLRDELILAYHEQIQAVGGRFHVMWGQTEAGPRMSTLPADRLPAKVGSPGCALPGGSLSVRGDDGTETTEPGAVGEIVYRGPNVMMGYAQTAADLAAPDELGGVLYTGDLGYLDADGMLFLTGRLKRIGKIFGVRVNLDDIEKLAGLAGADLAGPVAAVPAGDKVVLWCAGDPDAPHRAELAKMLAERLKLHRSGFDVRALPRLPLLSNGKVDYPGLEAAG